MKRIFLHTEWRNLIMINYEVNPELLQPYLPAGTELDDWNNKYFISMVGFKFLNTKVKGIQFPFHVNFEQVNLRFYVKRKTNNEIRHGVVFIKEIIDKSIVKLMANTLYNENYVKLPMQHQWAYGLNKIDISYQWKLNNKWNEISCSSTNQTTSTKNDSEEQFIAEHYWGYVQINNKKSYEFRVEHPAWKIYHLTDYQIDVDFKTTYGKSFEFLAQKEPSSVFLVKGSEVLLGDKKLFR